MIVPPARARMGAHAKTASIPIPARVLLVLMETTARIILTNAPPVLVRTEEHARTASILIPARALLVLMEKTARLTLTNVILTRASMDHARMV